MRLSAAGAGGVPPPRPGGGQLLALGKLSSMFFRVVVRSCWPESHFTGSVQKVPAPT